MTRFLLTLLALLTGLAAAGSPTQARICSSGDTQIGALAVPSGGEQIAVLSQGSSAPAARRASSERRDICQRPVRRPIYTPSVQLKVDRAHE